MNFDLSDEQVMIQDSVTRFVRESYAFDQRNKTIALESGYSPDHWQMFAELGWLAIPFREESEGLGGGPVEEMVLMREFGKGLVAEPFLSTILLFGRIIEAGASAATRSDILAQIMGGELLGAVALAERKGRFDLDNISTTAAKSEGKWTISGAKTVVLGGGAADKLVVLAATPASTNQAEAASLFLVDARAQGVSRETYRLTDGRDAASIQFDNVIAEELLGGEGQGLSLLQPVLDKAIMAVCADALGAMEALNQQTLEHLKTRQQFGTHIGAFQALQHRAVDMLIAEENTRSLLYRAVCAAESGDDDADRSLLALKVMVGRAGRLIGSESIQMHGGMGMSEELCVGAYMKRLLISNTLFGDADYQQQRFMELSRS